MKKFFIIFLEGAIFAMTLSGCKTDTEILSESMDSGVSEQQMFNESISTDMSNLFDYSQYEKEHFTITIERINNQTAYQNLIKKTAETKPLLDQYLAYFHHPLMSSSLTIMQYDEKFPIDCLRKIDEQHVYCGQR